MSRDAAGWTRSEDIANAADPTADRLPLTALVIDFGEVGALDLCGDSDEGPAEGVLGRGVHHLLLNLGLVRRPEGMDEDVDRTRSGPEAFESSFW